MYFVDANQHHTPHIHVESNGKTASVSLDGRVLAGQIDKRKLTVLQAWMLLHEEELKAAWQSLLNAEPFGTIEPLR
jgi:hypothetical protein